MAATAKPWEDGMDTNTWLNNGMCTCGGILQYKYLNNGMELRVMPNRNMFVVRKQGKVIASGKMETLKEQISALANPV
jgi:hypothetical protein